MRLGQLSTVYSEGVFTTKGKDQDWFCMEALKQHHVSSIYFAAAAKLARKTNSAVVFTQSAASCYHTHNFNSNL